MNKIYYIILLLTSITIFQYSCKNTMGISKNDSNIFNLEIEYFDHEGKRDFFKIYYFIKNNTEKPISLLRSRPIKRYPNGIPPADCPPEFFKVKVSPDDIFCETAPLQAGTNDVKIERDFLTILPHSQKEMIVYTSFYSQSICNEDIDQVSVSLQYDFDERLLDKSFFETEIKNKKRLTQEESDNLYQWIKNSYQGEIEPVITEIDLNQLQAVNTNEEERYIQKAIREHGIRLSRIFLPNYTNRYPAIIIDNDKKLSEQEIKALNLKMDELLPHNGGRYLLIKNKDKLDKITTKQQEKGKYTIYHYKDIQNLVDSMKTELAGIMKDSEFKDYTVYGIYYPTSYLYPQYHRIQKGIFMILKDKDNQYYYTYFAEGKIYPKLRKMTLVDNTFKTTFGTYRLEKAHTLEIQKNGDLADKIDRKDNKEIIEYNAYYIKVK